MDADEFAARFGETREAIAIELKYSGEQATIRRMLDRGCALERAILLTLLGHGQHLALRVRDPGDRESAEAQQSDERAKRF